MSEERVLVPLPGSEPVVPVFANMIEQVKTRDFSPAVRDVRIKEILAVLEAETLQCASRHVVTQGREGQTGSWCVECGVKVMEVHDRPCNECAHYAPDDYPIPRPPYCKRKLMLVTRSMHVCYFIDRPFEQGGLCFEPNKETANAAN